MTISTDPARETPLQLKERRPFSLLLVCEKQDKSRVNLTGSTLSLVIADVVRKGGDAKVTVAGTLVSAVDGTVRFDVQASQLDFGVGLYDLAVTLTTVEGYAVTIVEGPVELTHNPDSTVPAAYNPSLVPPLSLTARFRDNNRVTVRVNHLPDFILTDAAARAETAASSAGGYRDQAQVAAVDAQTAATGVADYRDQAQAWAQASEQHAADAAVSANASSTSAAASAASASDAEALNGSAAIHRAAAEAAATSAQSSADTALLARNDTVAFRDSAEIHNGQAAQEAANAASSADEAAASAAAAAGASVPNPGTTGQVLTSDATVDRGYDWKPLSLPVHTHDDRYYTEGEIDAKFIDQGTSFGSTYYSKGQADARYIAQTPSIMALAKVTQAQYDTLVANSTVVATTLYVIVG